MHRDPAHPLSNGAKDAQRPGNRLCDDISASPTLSDEALRSPHGFLESQFDGSAKGVLEDGVELVRLGTQKDSSA